MGGVDTGTKLFLETREEAYWFCCVALTTQRHPRRKGDAVENLQKLLSALGARLIVRGVEGGREIAHYLMPDGRVVEIVG